MTIIAIIGFSLIIGSLIGFMCLDENNEEHINKIMVLTTIFGVGVGLIVGMAIMDLLI